MKAFKIIATGITGGFAKSPDLEARFWAWFVFTLLLIGAFTFDSWISFSVFADYLSYIGSAGDVPGLILSVSFAMAATVSVGVIAYAFVAYRKSINSPEQLSDSLRFAGYIAAGLYLCFAGISILANIQGAQQAAERHADSQIIVDDAPLVSTTAEWTAEKEKTTLKYDNEIAKLEARLAAAENGTTTEQGRYNGKRGNAYWKGKKTPYGRALIADLLQKKEQKEADRELAIAALDATYQTRLNTQTASFNRKSKKHAHKKEKATTAIRLIVFLIYPIGLGISIFNAHFLYDVQLFLGRKVNKPSHSSQNHSVGFGALPKTAIGFHQQRGENPNDLSKITAEMRAEIREELRAEMEKEMRGETLKNTGKIESFERPEASHSSSTIYLSNNTPYNLGKKYDMSKAEKRQLTKVTKARKKIIEETGKEPSANAIAKATDMSWATAKKYLEMIRKES